MEQEYLTPRQVAELLRVDYTTVMRWIRTGLLDVETMRQGKRNRHRIKKPPSKHLKHHPLPPASHNAHFMMI